MTKAPIRLQELRRRIYRKAKSDKSHRFWGIFVHVAKIETSQKHTHGHAGKAGAPGIDGQTFSDIEASGLSGSCRPFGQSFSRTGTSHGRIVRSRSEGVGKSSCAPDSLHTRPSGAGGSEAHPRSYLRGRLLPKLLRIPAKALAASGPGRVRRSLLRRMSTVIDVDLTRYFDTIRHSTLLEKIARRVQDPAVMRLIKLILKAGGKVGVPQGGPFSPLAANIYLNEMDWYFDAIRIKTAQGPYEAVNYHRFSDDIVITVSGHRTKRDGPRGLYSAHSSHRDSPIPVDRDHFHRHRGR